MRWLKILSVLLLCLVNLAVAQNDNDDENLRVKINSGIVQGRLRHVEGTTKTYYSFQGIPYAEPPINDLRFRNPVPARNWEGVLPTQGDEHKCIQEYEAKGSEDCLYINVFTPDINGSNIPVMVWIYGGAFNKGSSKIKKYSPDYFLEEHIIIVTFNYRVGVFGFLSTEDSASPGNYGLKDQILALQWVKDNIGHFGGNSESITVFGQSAGSASVAYLLQTPLTTMEVDEFEIDFEEDMSEENASKLDNQISESLENDILQLQDEEIDDEIDCDNTDDLFHRAIMQSGTSLNLWALTRNPKTTAFAIGKSLGIETKNSTILVNALRKIETSTLQATAVSNLLLETIVSNPRNGLVFGPSTEPNLPGAVVIKKSHEMLNYGDFNRIPCMVGFNSAEGTEAASIIDYVRPYVFMYDLFSSKLVPIDMNIQSIFRKTFVALSIRQRYFGVVPISLSDEDVAKFVTDDQFVRPIYEYVSLISKYVPVYFYRFSYEGVTGINGQPRKNKGVGHSEELSYMWKQKDNIADPPETDIITRKRLVKLWTNFAQTSNPTPEKDDLFQNVIWPVAKHRNITYLDIGQSLKVTTDMSYYNIEFWRLLYKNFGFPPYDTY
ncbi:carboxylesterase 1D-like [Anoplophora glabripennis]|uniref:carboxylesterase 1D-like n=1 Tax=Anoplophora glabripennis TaxID=217634 RepID=UPI000C78B949|nr:carboxylesterase 1D-like [Anoplophora glabripennis]